MEPVPSAPAEEFLRAFSSWSTDARVTSSYFRRLGPADTLTAVSNWASAETETDEQSDLQDGLLDQVRIALESASRAPEFDAQTFARGLVEQASVHPRDLPDIDAAFPVYALAVLLTGGSFGSNFLKTVGSALDECDRLGNGRFEFMWEGSADLMAAFMSALRRSPLAALEFFGATEGDGQQSRIGYYLGQRQWRDIDVDEMFAALVSATTHRDVIEQPEAERLAVLCVRLVADRPDFDRFLAIAARPGNSFSLQIACILTAHLAYFERLLADNGAFAGSLDVGQFERFTSLAVASDDGFEEVRFGLDDHRAEQGEARRGGLDELFVRALGRDSPRTLTERVERAAQWRATDEAF